MNYSCELNNKEPPPPHQAQTIISLDIFGPDLCSAVHILGMYTTTVKSHPYRFNELHLGKI